jgi:16S rRNA C967 or C1407 C5-methylase (RsmB/RsmF family)
VAEHAHFVQHMPPCSFLFCSLLSHVSRHFFFSSSSPFIQTLTPTGFTHTVPPTLAVMSGPPTAAAAVPSANYPSTFSAELIEHCRQGCIPPEVFADAQSLLNTERRQRYVRVNPRCTERVLYVGVEGVLRLQALTAASTAPSPLTKEEEQLWCDIQVYTSSVSPPETQKALTICKEYTRARVPELLLLRLGVAGLAGLPLASVHPVPWLPCGVFALPWSFAMGNSLLFREGVLIAMDAASIAAVVALRPRRGERVLDLCCAPGMKLGLIADAVAHPHAGQAQDGKANGLAVGVDVSLSRLYMSRSILKKQQGGTGVQGETSTAPSCLPVCVFAGDGRHFTLADAVASMDGATATTVDPSTGLTARERRALQRLHGCSGTKQDRVRSVSTAATSSGSSEASGSSGGVHVVYAPAPARESVSMLLQQQQRQTSKNSDASAPTWLFDRVLVDAECSHDGSVAHIQLEDGTTQPASVTCSAAITRGRGLTNAYRMQHLNLDNNGTGAVSNPCTASTGSSKVSSLFDLQLELLCNGYRQLKPGGTLVYSTCSYAFTQDELVVRRFLARVNAPAAMAQNAVPVTATVVPAFSYAHEGFSVGEGSSDGAAAVGQVASCVAMPSEAAQEALQQRLDAHALDYGVVEEGVRRYLSQTEMQLMTPLGSRLWPRTFNCSFLYVAKIWKKVEAVEEC